MRNVFGYIEKICKGYKGYTFTMPVMSNELVTTNSNN